MDDYNLVGEGQVQLLVVRSAESRPIGHLFDYGPDSYEIKAIKMDGGHFVYVCDKYVERENND